MSRNEMMQRRLQATLESCTERMKRVWASGAVPPEPEFTFRITFTATESTGKLVQQFVRGCPTRDRHISVSKAKGGDA